MVKDLPNIPELRRPDGTYVDLGYHFKPFSKGEWVGYVGSSSSFLNFTETELQLLLKLGRLDKLPPVPHRPPTSELATYFLYFLIAAGVVGWLVKLGIVPRKTRRQQNTSPSFDEPSNEPSPALLAKMMEAAGSHQRAVGSGAYQPSTRSMPKSSQTTFGKRI